MANRSIRLHRNCKCGLPLVRRIAWTQLNPCRRFLNCRNSNDTSERSCDAFYWIDPELNNGWYKNQMIELYLALNPEERYEYVEQTRVQDAFEVLQSEYELYQADMEFQLYEAKKGKSLWKKIVVFLFVLFVIVKFV